MDAHDHSDVPADPHQFQEAIDRFLQRVPMTSDLYDELADDERDFAFTVANVAQADLVGEVYDGVLAAIERGETFEDFQARVGDDLAEEWGGEDPARLETIFRTNVMDSYNAGRYDMMTAPAVREERPYWRFDAIQDDRTDDACEDLDGIVLAQDDPFWSSHYPPLHFNCRCVLAPLTAEDAEAEGGVDDAPDDDHASDGFGDRPDAFGTDWEPDPGTYPAPIGAALREKLAAQ